MARSKSKTAKPAKQGQQMKKTGKKPANTKPKAPTKGSLPPSVFQNINSVLLRRGSSQKLSDRFAKLYKNQPAGQKSAQAAQESKANKKKKAAGAAEPSKKEKKVDAKETPQDLDAALDEYRKQTPGGLDAMLDEYKASKDTESEKQDDIADLLA